MLHGMHDCHGRYEPLVLSSTSSSVGRHSELNVFGTFRMAGLRRNGTVRFKQKAAKIIPLLIRLRGGFSGMRYWWVNQNQTYRHEFNGRYLWSPKRSKNNQRNPSYEFMREVSPGDLIFSFCDTLIPALGIAESNCYESPRPEEFGVTGQNWGPIGWKIKVRFVELRNQIRPKNHMTVLGPVLPRKYSPLQASGNGNQGIYLTELPSELAELLIGLIGREAEEIARALYDRPPVESQTAEVIDTEEWENHIEEVIQAETSAPETERAALIAARRGQGLFRERMMRIERRCRITLVDNPIHLHASHTKPWRDATNDERLDGENGLLLTPSIDHLFDRGFISFRDDGQLLVSPAADRISLRRLGVDTEAPVNVGIFSRGQRAFLEYHRNWIFLEAQVGGSSR
jgi:putative restriction endonuclease